MAVTDLDLSIVNAFLAQDDAEARFSLNCSGNRSCVEYVNTGGSKRLSFGTSGPSNGTTTYMQVYCSTVSDCRSFAAAIRDAVAGRSQPATTRSRAGDASTSSSSGRGAGASGRGAGARRSPPTEPPVLPRPALSDKRDKRLPEESAEQKQAAALLEESKRLFKEQQDCLAAMTTYRPRPLADLPPGCLSDIDRQSVSRDLYPYRTIAPPSGSNPETVIDGSRIPSQIDFPGRAIDRVFVGPLLPPARGPQPSSRASSDLDSAQNTPSTIPQPAYDSILPPLRSNGAAPSPTSSVGGDGTGPSLSMVRDEPEKPEFAKLIDRVLGGPPSPGPMRQVGAADDTLADHQADLDNATKGSNYVKNFLKYPLEDLRVVKDKMDRVLEFQPPDR
jgi:hypothetical protein